MLHVFRSFGSQQHHGGDREDGEVARPQHNRDSRLTLCSSYKDTTLVKLQAEGSEEVFHVQKCVLLRASKYFVAALDGNFQEAETQHLRLPGCDDPKLKRLLHWLSCNGIPNFDTEIRIRRMEGADSGAASRPLLLLMRFWVLGDLLSMAQAQNEAMKSLLDIASKHDMPFEAIRQGYVLTPLGSNLSNAIMDPARWEYSKSRISDEQFLELAMVPDFLTDFMYDAYCWMRADCSIFQERARSGPGEYLVKVGQKDKPI